MSDLPTSGAQPVSENDIAHFLVRNPAFFERHAEVLAAVQLASPHGERAVSLPERQAAMLREKIRTLEQRLVELVRNGGDNTVTAERLQRWAVQLVGVQDAATLPARIVAASREQFMVPQAALRLWDLPGAGEGASYTQGVDADVRAFTASLDQPYCGPNRGFEVTRWLDEPERALSLALLPLRAPAAAAAGQPAGARGAVFGLLVLASADASRFTAEMGVDFLERMAELASAALGRLHGA